MHRLHIKLLKGGGGGYCFPICPIYGPNTYNVHILDCHKNKLYAETLHEEMEFVSWIVIDLKNNVYNMYFTYSLASNTQFEHYYTVSIPIIITFKKIPCSTILRRFCTLVNIDVVCTKKLFYYFFYYFNFFVYVLYLHCSMVYVWSNVATYQYQN